MWDAETGKLLLDQRPDSGSPVTDVAFSPDGRLLATAEHDRPVQRLRDAGSGGVALEIHDLHSTVDAVAFSYDGRRIAFGGAAVAVRDAASGGKLAELPRPLPDRVYLLRFSRDGKRLAVVGQRGFGIWVWENGSGGWKDLPGSGSGSSVEGAFGVAFSPDGKSIAGYGGENTVRVWDVASGVQLGSFFGGQGRIRAVAFTPDGKYLDAVDERWAVYRHPVQLNELIAEARDRLTGELTASECREYLSVTPCPKWAQALALVAEGNALARGERADRIDVDGAAASYRKAIGLDPELKLDSEAQLKRLADSSIATRVGLLVRQHRVKEAVAAYRQAQSRQPKPEIFSAYWNNLCWQGAIQGRAAGDRRL